MTAILHRIILDAVKQAGTYDPAEALPYIEDLLTIPEFKQAEGFLGWVHAKGKAFGHGNINEVFAEYLKALNS